MLIEAQLETGIKNFLTTQRAASSLRVLTEWRRAGELVKAAEGGGAPGAKGPKEDMDPARTGTQRAPRPAS